MLTSMAFVQKCKFAESLVLFYISNIFWVCGYNEFEGSFTDINFCSAFLNVYSLYSL